MKKITVQKSSLLLLATLFPASSSTFAKESEEKLYKRLAKCTIEVGKEKKKLKLGGELKINTYTWCYFGVELTKLPFCQSKKDSGNDLNDPADDKNDDNNSSVLKTFDEAVVNCHVEIKNSSGEYVAKIGKMHNACSDKELIGVALESPRVGLWLDVRSMVNLFLENEQDRKNPLASVLLTFKPEAFTVKTGFNLARGEYSGYALQSLVGSGHITIDYGTKNALADQIKKLKLAWKGRFFLKKHIGTEGKEGISLDISLVPKKIFDQYKAEIGAGMGISGKKGVELKCNCKITIEEGLTFKLGAKIPKVLSGNMVFPEFSLSCTSEKKWLTY